ncbi:MAG TPA: 1-deoxy-D-xylulose-5-phosphate reductoisomerase [Clostridiaceae bacterium]|nr:1-deoxy-D-xylulose-5-phosphate reductoisomerase [Clostridiaceae bacterium]
MGSNLPVPRRLNDRVPQTRKLAILGSTGSIGTQSLEVARDEGFEVVSLAAGRNVERLIEQIRLFRPDYVSVQDKDVRATLIERLIHHNVSCPEIGVGREGLVRAAKWDEADTIVAAITGFAGLEPVLAAASSGKKIALANKEALVVAGYAVMQLASDSGALILPVDSEHSAIWQCLLSAFPSDLHHVVLTCSGGPFFGQTRDDLAYVSVAQALAHPTWSMGDKITIDSATLMNKAFELIEACHLYGLEPDDVRVVIHPQSRVHSLVAFKDGSYLAQLGSPDMRVPIRYALTFPYHSDCSNSESFGLFDSSVNHVWTFAKVDEETFPSLRLARKVWHDGGLMPLVFNASNEAAVRLFLDGVIQLTQIFDFVERALVEFSYMSSIESSTFDDMMNGHHRVMRRVHDYKYTTA